MPKSLAITFADGDNRVFYANQVLSGTVELTIDENVKARGLVLTIKGKAVCKWIETYGGGKSRSRRTFEGSQEFLNSVTPLFGSKEDEAKEVPMGVHSYNFECFLPEPIPYSAEGKHGYIRYKVEASLIIPWGFDLKLVKPFTVLRNDDLRHIRYDDLRDPFTNEENVVFCCWVCKSDPLFIKVQLPKTGFGLGEKIPIFVEMVNRSSKNVTTTCFVLKKIEQFNSVMPFKKNKIIESTIASKRSTGVRAGKAINFSEFLEIPDNVATSNNRLCAVFQIKYELKFTAFNDAVSNPTDIVIPITIGTSGFPDFPPSPLDDLPPSFEEATRPQT